MIPICLGPNISRTAGVGPNCYLATIAICYIVCCEAVRSAILATAWLLVVLCHVAVRLLVLWETKMLDMTVDHLSLQINNLCLFLRPVVFYK